MARKQSSTKSRRGSVVARAIPHADMLTDPARQYETSMRRPADARFEALMTEDGEEGVIEIYDIIGSYETNFRTVSDALKRMSNASQITVRINSPGGLVFDGFAIYNALRAHGAHIRVEIMGLAASAASVIAMAGDQIAIADNGFLMIHNASAVTWGNARDMVKTADMLAKIDKAIIATYARRTGMKGDKLAALLDAETWLDAEDAVSMKFADETLESVDASALALDVSPYAKAPGVLVRASRAKPAAQPKPAAPVEDWSAVAAAMARLTATLKG